MLQPGARVWAWALGASGWGGVGVREMPEPWRGRSVHQLTVANYENATILSSCNGQSASAQTGGIGRLKASLKSVRGGPIGGATWHRARQGRRTPLERHDKLSCSEMLQCTYIVCQSWRELCRLGTAHIVVFRPGCHTGPPAQPCDAAKSCCRRRRVSRALRPGPAGSCPTNPNSRRPISQNIEP